ncbi:MAG: hypothetical protein J7L47_06955 [Candidatus Odinarchaeota archaeon]|nr:hypothetical protein [Candidatus Odinarchaeota archaeon]
MQMRCKQVLNFFLEKGVIATLRSYPYRAGQHIVINRKYKAIVQKVYPATPQNLITFLDYSSFKTVDEWMAKAKELHGKMPRFLVLVSKIPEKKKVYFAHPIPTYNTLSEKKWIEIIEEHFPGAEVINPKKYFLGSMDDYLQIVQQCDAIVFVRWHGWITSGVAKEIHYAFKKGIPVYEIKKGKIVQLREMPRRRILSYEDTIIAYRDENYLKLLKFLL